MGAVSTAGSEGYSLGTPALGDADFLVKAATGAELPNNETVTYIPATDGTSPMDGDVGTTSIVIEGVATTVWDVRAGATYGRNLVGVATHLTDVVAMTMIVSGYDYLLQAMSELFTFPAAGTNETLTATGGKAFAYVTSVAITAAGDAEANTLNVGTGAKLGLPYRLAKAGHVLAASLGGVSELINVASNATVVAATATDPATNATGDARGTIAFNTALDGSKEAFIHYHVSGRLAVPQALHGLTQA
jgi:hypothetical protein